MKILKSELRKIVKEVLQESTNIKKINDKKEDKHKIISKKANKNNI